MWMPRKQDWTHVYGFPLTSSIWHHFQSHIACSWIILFCIWKGLSSCGRKASLYWTAQRSHSCYCCSVWFRETFSLIFHHVLFGDDTYFVWSFWKWHRHQTCIHASSCSHIWYKYVYSPSSLWKWYGNEIPYAMHFALPFWRNVNCDAHFLHPVSTSSPFAFWPVNLFVLERSLCWLNNGYKFSHLAHCSISFLYWQAQGECEGKELRSLSLILTYLGDTDGIDSVKIRMHR